MEEEKTFTEYLFHKKRHRRHHRNASHKSSVKQSNSDTNFIINRDKEIRDEIEDDIREKTRQNFKSSTYNHKHSSHCKYCKGFNKILKKDQTELSSYIENNSSYLRLLGNQRYNKTSPLVFVEDHRNKIPERKMGLIPIPVKKNRTKSMDNKLKLYNLQRGIVMIRRYQYGFKNLFILSEMNNTNHTHSYDITLIQKWWKKNLKIIFIQKMFRGYFIRKQVNAVNNLYKFMDKFELIVIKLKKEKFIKKLLYKVAMPKKRKPYKYSYISKQRNLINIKYVDKVIIIQKMMRGFKSRINYHISLREQKFVITNNKAFFSKKNYRIKDAYDKIKIIQFNIRKYLRNINCFSNKKIDKEIGPFYIEKNYVDEYSMKIIDFYKLLLHGLRLKMMKKIRIKYKNINEYNKDDINKVIFIQKNYLKHYYSKHKIKLAKTKRIKKIGIIDKLRLRNDINDIKLIQNRYRKYSLTINKYKKKLIRNKPISFSIKEIQENNINIMNNNNKFNDKYDLFDKRKSKKYKNKKNSIYYINKDKEIDEKNFYSNGRLNNNICYYSKEYKINQMNQVLFLQTKIYSYLFLKKLKKKEKSINKSNFNKIFFISKINTDENKCIEKIKLIQKVFKKSYKYMKNNIIENFNSKTSSESNDSYYKNRTNKINYNYTNKFKYIPKSNYKNSIIPNKNDKYSNKYNKNNNNKKSSNYSFSIPKDIHKKSIKEKKTLKEKIEKNKTPKKPLKGNYITKKRVEKIPSENYLTFNKKIYKPNIKEKISYISKTRFYNNEAEIKLIQNFWKKISPLNLIKKPLNNEILNIKKISISNNITPTKINKFSYINNKYKSNRKNILPNSYDNDEYFENIPSKTNSINITNNKNNNNNDKNDKLDLDINLYKYGFIIKTRKINFIKYILLLQNNIRKFLLKKNYIKKNNIEYLYIYKYRIDNFTYNRFIQFIEENKTVIKIDKNIDNNYISKKRYSNYISNIITIQKNWKIYYKNKYVYKKLKPKKIFITKKRLKNNENSIYLIQKIIRSRIFAKNEEKNKTVSRKFIISNSLYNKKRYSRKNSDKINIPYNSKGNKNKINKKLAQNMENYLSNNKKNLIKLSKKKDGQNININQNQNINNSDISSSYDTESAKSFNKKEFSYAKINYITKIYKLIVYKKKLNLRGNFVSKEFRIVYKKKKDFSFINLLQIFATKNVQEYIFYYLKYGIDKKFSYPYYIKTLQRVLKFLKSSKVHNQNEGGEKIIKFFAKLFPNIFTQKPPILILSSLNEEIENNLVKTNIYNAIEPDFVNYISNFSAYDKHLSNIKFMETRLKNTKLMSTNIFSITKFIDDEYNNLIYGKYCFKCFLDINTKCLCDKNKNKTNFEFYSNDDELDIEFDPFYFRKHNFEYDSIKWKDISVKRKPKSEEVYEDPITQLILRNKKSEKNNSINISESQFGTNATYGSRILNKIKNDIENENNSLNNSKNIAKIKAVYHQSNNIKKENLILIKDNNEY